MARLFTTRAGLVLALSALGASAGCSDDDDDTIELLDASRPSDAGTTPVIDGGKFDIDASKPDAGPVVSALTSCLDSPTTLPRPSPGKLTCDLFPPGLSL